MKWKETLFPHAKILNIVGGAVPVSGVLEQTVADNFLLVGDAAHQTDPMTGGGIAAGMRGGLLAAQAIDEAFKAGDFSELFLQRYDRLVWERIGKGHGWQLRVRRWILEMSRNQQIDFFTLIKSWVDGGQSWPKAIAKHPLMAAKIGVNYLTFK